MTPTVQRLTGWGRTAPGFAEVVEVSAADAAQVVKTAGPRGALARGLGRSYGDSAQNSGGLVMRLAGSMSDAILDRAAGTVTVGAGVSLDVLLRHIVPNGFFVPVTPGTRFVTVGGAIASDIHGKNHHREGSFGSHVESLDLLLADGTTATVSPAAWPELFWATVGGMGLTGVILRATVRLLPIETSLCRVDTSRIDDIDHLMAEMVEGDARFRYSVAWIDPMAKGASLGRSVLSRGDHARVEHLTGKALADPLRFHPRQKVNVPPVVPPMGVMNHLTVAAFNEMWFRKAPRHREGEIQSIASFFHPLDFVGSWNRLYGRSGMVQYQCVVPDGAEAAMRTVVERLSSSGAASFLAVLKRFGPANPAPLSFPMPGWTLALDVPGGWHGLGPLLHGLDTVVLDAGGRHYLSKDAHTTALAIRRGYPRLDAWKAVRDEVDPTGVWRSDQARRLGLVD